MRNQLDKLLFDFLSLVSGLLHLVQTTLELRNIAVIDITARIEQARERLDEDQVGRGRDVVVTTQLKEVALTKRAHTLLHINTNSDDTILHGQVFDLAQEEFSDISQGIRGPWQEPIDCAAIDQGREHSKTALKVFTDRRES